MRLGGGSSARISRQSKKATLGKHRAVRLVHAYVRDVDARCLSRNPAGIRPSRARGGLSSRKLMSTAIQPRASAGDGAICQRWQTQGRCHNGECENLHLQEGEAQKFEQRLRKMKSPGRLIVAAGPERSGSTWLFNALRLLYEEADEALHAYWMHNITDAKLQQRHCGQPVAPHVLIKTHCWSDDWDPNAYPDVKIFLTHRDLRGVVASYMRLGWAFDVPSSYVADHQRWQALAHRDIAFENIMTQPQLELQALADELGLSQQVDISAVHERLQSLKAPDSGPPDPVTKLWARHLSPQTLAQQAGGSGKPVQAGTQRVDNDGLRRRFPEYFEQYGY